MKKTIIFILLIIIVIGIKPNKIYLTSKYYNEGKFIETTDLSNLNKENYILYTYNPYCTFETPCEDIFKSFMEKYKIDFISMPFDKFKQSYLYQKVKYAPSIIIVKEGKVKAYLDANSDKDTPKYQDEEELEKWIEKYVHLEKE